MTAADRLSAMAKPREPWVATAGRERPAGRAFSPALLRRLVPAAAERRCDRGEVIFRRGERGDTMYLVERGTVALAFDEVKTRKRLAAGDCFGELALILGEHRRAATAIAASSCRLRVLDRASFEALLAGEPAVAAALLRRACSYLVESERALIEDLRRQNQELERTLDYLRRTKEELDSQELLAQTDELTGVYNRRCLNAQIERLLNRPADTGRAVALLLLDVDRFKWINDTHGHPTGDEVLKGVAARIRGAVRSTDLPCRIGGDEFAVLLPNLSEGEARERALRLLVEVGSFRLRWAGTELRIGASIGGALHRPGEDWRQLQERADQDLYLAKQSGGRRLGWGGQILGSAAAPPSSRHRKLR